MKRYPELTLKITYYAERDIGNAIYENVFKIARKCGLKKTALDHDFSWSRLQHYISIKTTKPIKLIDSIIMSRCLSGSAWTISVEGK